MTDDPIKSAADLRDELAAIIRRYVQHLDFDAPTDLTTVRIEATGPGLSVIYAEHATEAPTLHVSINDFAGSPPPPDVEGERRGFLR